MGIVMHDVNEVVMDLSVPGTQTTNANAASTVMPFAGTIRGILARLGTAPTVAGNNIFDILKNGTTIFAAAPKITFATGATTPTYSALTANPTIVAKGDVLTVANVGTATVGVNLGLLVTIRRNRASVEGVDTDSISAKSDAI